jgi:hypothetical protein
MPNGYPFDRDKYQAQKAAKAKAKADVGKANNTGQIKAVIESLMQALGL